MTLFLLGVLAGIYATIAALLLGQRLAGFVSHWRRR